ncbi:MAG: acetoacetate decarboxylase family protein [Anaerolineae bacterium]|nr:acetoacetate decarboxylase family protein [Anaerolineae bacterium]
MESAQRKHFAAGDVLFYQGDPARELTVLAAGTCSVQRPGADGDIVHPGALLDPTAALGELPHAAKVSAVDDVETLGWPLDLLRNYAGFSTAAQRFLAGELRTIQTRLAQLETPIHYQETGAILQPGPFMFEDVAMIITFCEANLDSLRQLLPPGVRLFYRPGRQRGPLFLAFAEFPHAYPEHTPGARFAYTETTCFVPVRHRRQVGLFVPHIYPSTWEPILLGREIYGFPKRLGYTALEPRTTTLAVDKTERLRLTWDGLTPANEPRLVRALVDWLGLEGHTASLAFQAGDLLRKAMQLPPYRAVGVFNHKRIPAIDTTADTPSYAVDQLTHATFGVLRWHRITRMKNPALTASGNPFAGMDLTLRDAYRTQLDMRLSVGHTVRDYLAESSLSTRP